MARLPSLAKALLLLVLPISLGACGNENGALSQTQSAAEPGSPNALTLPATQQGLSLIAARLGNGCVQPTSSALAQVGTPVVVQACQGIAAERWFLDASGHLSLADGLALGVAADGTSLQLVASDANSPISWQLRGGHLVAGSVSGTNAKMVMLGATADGNGAYPLTLETLSLATTDQSYAFSVGQATLGAGNTLLLNGFVIRLATDPTMCLTGSGSQIGVAACQSASTQLFTLNSAGALQLGGYCVGVDTAGTIAQGTTPVFAACETADARQAWVIAGRSLTLGGLSLVPQIQPPPSFGLTQTSLSTGQALWLMGM